MRAIQSEYYGDNVRWFIGIVEQIDGDPLKLGRIKVRIYGVHSPDTSQVDIVDLPWANVIIPVTQGGVGGSTNPTGIQRGARVFGFFADGAQSQIPMILGSIPHNYSYDVKSAAVSDPFINAVSSGRSYYRVGDPITDEQVNELVAAGVDRGFFKKGQTLNQDQANILNENQPLQPSGVPLVGGTRQEQAFNFLKQYFMDRGSEYPGVQSAAFVGNFINESGPALPPNAGPTYKGVQGANTRWGQEKSFGIAQWNLAAGRMGNLEGFVSRMSPPTVWADFGAQLEFVKWELENTHTWVWPHVKKSSTIRRATAAVLRFYETPEVAVNYNRYQQNRTQFSPTRQSEIVRKYEAELDERVNASFSVLQNYGGE